MDWLMALVLVYGSLQDAADTFKQEEAIRAAIMHEEIIMYADKQTADMAMSANWTVMPAMIDQGDALLVRSQTEQSLEWNGKTYSLMPFGSGYYTLLPVPANMKPGRYAIGDQHVSVVKKKFETQHLKVTQQQEAMRRNTDRIKEDQEKVGRARSESEPSFLFNQPFVQPVEGRLSTPYGFTRYINGVFSGSHNAIDLAAAEGTPVKAANAGKIVLAEELYLTGNSIYIDHGMHLFSQYAHMSKLLVESGEEVEAGQVIGLVGTTGFSTGPHLHFTFWLHNVPANPFRFFDSSPFFWK